MSRHSKCLYFSLRRQRFAQLNAVLYQTEFQPDNVAVQNFLQGEDKLIVHEPAESNGTTSITTADVHVGPSDPVVLDKVTSQWMVQDAVSDDGHSGNTNSAYASEPNGDVPVSKIGAI